MQKSALNVFANTERAGRSGRSMTRGLDRLGLQPVPVRASQELLM